MESLSIDQLQAKAQELVDTFGAKGDLIEIAKWLDSLMRGGMAPAAETPADPEEMSTEISPEEAAIATAARRFTGFQSVQAIEGAFAAHKEIKKERDLAVTELRKIKHSAEVEKAITEKRLAPGRREEALRADPEHFKAFISLASPIIDVEVVTPDTRINKSAAPTVADLEKDPGLIAYCARMGLDAKTYAQNFARFGVPFSE